MPPKRKRAITDSGSGPPAWDGVHQRTVERRRSTDQRRPRRIVPEQVPEYRADRILTYRNVLAGSNWRK